MLLEHFGLTEDPFGVTPDPRFIYFGREHREALASLYYSIVESRGFAAMVAPPGMGKTTLLHYLQDKMKDAADFVVLVCSFEDKNELLQAVMNALRLEVENGSYFQNWKRLHSFLLKRHEQNRKVVLICDEAQSLTTTALENIRLLSNLETTRTKLLQIILAGQPCLVHKLRSRELEQLGQRTNVSCQIHPLDEAEVETYILHRLETAGRRRRLFTTSAVSAVVRSALGIPRNINTICSNAMALTLALGRRLVDGEQVNSSVEDLSLAEFSNPSALKPVSIGNTTRHALPESAALELLGFTASSNGGPVRMKVTLPEYVDGQIVRSLAAQLSEMLNKLESLSSSIEKLSGVPTLH